MLVVSWGSHSFLRYNWLWCGAFQAIALHCLKRPPDAAAGELAEWADILPEEA
jgi:hypothetical protein